MFLLALSPQQRNDLLKALIDHFQLDRSKNAPLRHWNTFNKKLDKAGITGDTQKCLSFWAAEHSRSLKKSKIPLRVLQPFEQEILSPEAQGYLIEISQAGILSTEQMETALEECFFMPPKVQIEDLQEIMIRVLNNQLEYPGSSIIH